MAGYENTTPPLAPAASTDPASSAATATGSQSVATITYRQQANFENANEMDKFSHHRIVHPRDQIVDIMQRMYDKKLTTMSGGNCSILDSDGTIWITPGSTDKGEMKRDEIVYRKKGSEIWEGKIGLKPSREWPFHTRILEERPDSKAVLHAHSQSLVAFSCIKKVPDTMTLYQAYHVCGKAAMSDYKMPGAGTLAEAIASKIVDHDCVIMESHGVVICGATLSACYGKFEVLEFCAEAIVSASALGGPRLLLSEEDYRVQQEVRLAELAGCVHGTRANRPQVTSKEAELRTQIIKFLHRAYETGLIVASFGAFSVRLSKKSFLATPMGVDRRFIEPNDILLFDTSREDITTVYHEKSVLTPSVSWKMQAALYRAFPDTDCVVYATPKFLSAFAMTDMTYPTDIHPETYIVCRDVARLGFRESLDPANVVDAFSTDIHALIINNRGVVICGTSVQEVYDKLEVLECTTKVILDCAALGGHNLMSKEQLEEIDYHYFGKGMVLERPMKKKKSHLDKCGHAAMFLELSDESDDSDDSDS